MENHEWAPASEALLKNVPPEAKLVKTMGEGGRIRWKKVDNILSEDLLGVRGAHPIVMLKPPGRRKQSELVAEHSSLLGESPKPDSDHKLQSRQIKEIQVRVKRQQFYGKDALLQAVLTNPDSEDIPALALKEFAVEASSLAYDRIQAEREGNSQSSSQLSIRRLKALEGLTSNWFKRQERLGQRTIDLNSPIFLALLGFMLETFRDAMLNGGVSGDQVQTTMTELSARFSDDTWINEAKSLMARAPQ